MIRTKLENILRQVKTKGTECKKYDTDTGGGPLQHSNFESADKTALALLGPRAKGLPNSWCDDEIESEFIRFDNCVKIYQIVLVFIFKLFQRTTE